MMFHGSLVEQFTRIFIKNIVNLIVKNGILSGQDAVF